ncbi:MAG: hypothetical protein ACI9MB_001164, partial [Verrucomicrobiales bacterium]
RLDGEREGGEGGELHHHHETSDGFARLSIQQSSE